MTTSSLAWPRRAGARERRADDGRPEGAAKEGLGRPLILDTKEIKRYLLKYRRYSGVEVPRQCGTRNNS